jgi:hypothetical protein
VEGKCLFVACAANRLIAPAELVKTDQSARRLHQTHEFVPMQVRHFSFNDLVQ